MLRLIVAKIELDYNVIENPLNPIFDKKTQKTVGSSWPPTSTILSWAQTSRRARKAPTCRQNVCLPRLSLYNLSSFFPLFSLVLSSLSFLLFTSLISPLALLT
jgi:hypothetical protein